mgnify:FL=1
MKLILLTISMISVSCGSEVMAEVQMICNNNECYLIT